MGRLSLREAKRMAQLKAASKQSSSSSSKKIVANPTDVLASLGAMATGAAYIGSSLVSTSSSASKTKNAGHLGALVDFQYGDQAGNSPSSGVTKITSLRNLLGKESIDFIAFQETGLAVDAEGIVKTIWTHDEFLNSVKLQLVVA